MKLIRKLYQRIRTYRLIFQKKFTDPNLYPKLIGVNIGENCFTPDKNTWSSEPYLITVGNNCQITSGVRIFTHGGGQAVRLYLPDFDVFGKVKIGNYVYIGNNSLIMPGVTIEDNVLIAAGTVVTKSIPSGVVVAGNPCKIVCTISEYLKRNEFFDLKTKNVPQDKKKKILLNIPENKFLRKKFLEL